MKRNGGSIYKEHGNRRETCGRNGDIVQKTLKYFKN